MPHRLSQDQINGPDPAPSDAPGPSSPADRAARNLTLEGAEITNASLDALAGQELESLMLYQTRVTDEGLAKLKRVRRLQRLYLRGGDFHGHGLAHLAEVPGLEELEVSGKLTGDDLLAHLMTLENLTALAVHGDAVTDESMLFVTHLTRLRGLNLYGTAVSDEGLAIVSRLEHLERLDLSHTAVTDAGLAALAEDRPGLKELRLAGHRNGPAAKRRVTDAGMEHIGKFKDLEVLQLYGIEVTDTGMERVAELVRLRSLALVGTDVSGHGLAAIERSPIEFLHIEERQARTGLHHLRKLERLSSLMVTCQGFDNSGFDAIREALPRCAVGFHDP